MKKFSIEIGIYIKDKETGLFKSENLYSNIIKFNDSKDPKTMILESIDTAIIAADCMNLSNLDSILNQYEILVGQKKDINDFFGDNFYQSVNCKDGSYAIMQFGEE